MSDPKRKSFLGRVLSNSPPPSRDYLISQDGLVIELVGDSEHTSLLDDVDEPESELMYQPPVLSPEPETCESPLDLDSDGYFSLLPDELVQHIFKKLDMDSFLALSHTCSRLYNLSLDEGTLRPVARDFHSTNLPFIGDRSRNDIVNVMKVDRITRLLNKRNDARSRAKGRLSSREFIEDKIVYLTGVSFLHEFLAPLFVLASLVMIAEKLDYNVDINWGVAFFPLIIILFFFVFRPLYFLMVHCFGVSDQDGHLDSTNFCAGLGVTFLPRKAFADHKNLNSMISYGAFVILTAITGISVFVQAATETLSWTLVFVLAALVAVSALVMNCIFGEKCNNCDEYEEREHRFPALIPLLCFISSCIVLALRASELVSPETNFHTLFIPIYITIGLTFIVPLATALYDLDEGEYSLGAAIALGIFVCIPFYVFFPLLAEKLNGNIDSSYVTIFIPLFVQFGVGFLGLLVGMFIRYLLMLSS